METSRIGRDELLDLSNEELACLWQDHKTPGTREIVLERFRAHIETIAWKRRNLAERDDLRQLMRMAVVRAVEKWDRTKDAGVVTLVHYYILENITRISTLRSPFSGIDHTLVLAYAKCRREGLDDAEACKKVAGRGGRHRSLDRVRLAVTRNVPADDLFDPLCVAPGEDPTEFILSGIEQAEMRPRLKEALATLPERDRNLFLGHVLEGRTLAEMAEEHGLSRQRINQIVMDAKKSLRSVLGRINADIARQRQEALGGERKAA